MAYTPPPPQSRYPSEGTISLLLPEIPPTLPESDRIPADGEAGGPEDPASTMDAVVNPAPEDLRSLADIPDAPATPATAGAPAISGGMDGPPLPGTPGSAAVPEAYLTALKDDALRKAEERETARQDDWVRKSTAELGYIHELLAGGDEAWKKFPPPPGADKKMARRTAMVDAYLQVFLREGDLPEDGFHRSVLRAQVAHLMFGGRGSESDEAFLDEMKEYGPFLSRKATPEIDGRIGLHEHLTMLARASALPGRGSLYPMEIPPAPDGAEEDNPLLQQFSRITKKIRVYGPDARGRGQETMDEMARFAGSGRIFDLNWRDGNAYAAYTSLRDAAAVTYGLTTEEIDDVIRHRLDAQQKDVSRDAFGEIHFKNRLVIQGVEAMRKAVADSDLTPLEKERQMDGLPERYALFQESVVASVMKDMPELAAELGVKSVADYDKITAVLNDGAWKQAAGGFLAAADGTMSSVDHLLGKAQGWYSDEGTVPYMTKRAQEVGRRSQANHQINALSQLFYKEQTSFLGVDAALIGQGVWSGLESAALVTVTAPLAPQMAVARYGRLAVAFNAAAKVAPAAGIFGVRQGFATYDQAIAAGRSPEEATRLAWYSGLIEGATTVAFSAIPGAGGLEDIASGSAREAFRRTLGESVRSAWKEGAKAFGKGVLAEIGEEELIAALDTAFVQTRIEPGMTGAQFMKRLYDTAITTAFASGAFSAAHGVHVYKDTLASNGRIIGEMGETTQAGVEPAPELHENAWSQESLTDETIPFAETANAAFSGPMVSEKVYETFSRRASDPTARVPDSEKIHRNIDIIRSRTRGASEPLDISSNEATPYREAFDRRYRAAEGFEVRKEFIPAASEAEARAEYARRHGQAAPEANWKANPVSAWVDEQGNATSFRDTRERDSWREDQIRSNHIIENRGDDGPTEAAGLTYEDAAKEHPFLEIMATIPHDAAKFNVKTGTFSMTSSQGGRTYELKGDISGSSIYIQGLFPAGENSNKAGTSSFGSDFLVTVLAFSRQMPGMTITANAARGKEMNGYAMWPKLGFEAKNPADILKGRNIPKPAAARMKELAGTGDGSLSLIKLNSTVEGQRLWKEHGGSIDVYLDTTPGNAVLEDLSDRLARQYQRSISRTKKASSNQNPDLPPH